MNRDNYWFAERTRDGDGFDPRWPWTPTLQGAGTCLSLPIWFATRAECEQYIRDEVIGAELQTDEQPASTPPELCSDKNGFHDGHDWTPDPCEPYRWCPGYPVPTAS